MRIAHPELDFYIDEKENSSAVLVIENENFLYKLLLELKNKLIRETVGLSFLKNLKLFLRAGMFF